MGTGKRLSEIVCNPIKTVMGIRQASPIWNTKVGNGIGGITGRMVERHLNTAEVGFCFLENGYMMNINFL